MSKLGYRFTLPAINFALAAILLVGGRQMPSPSHSDFPYTHPLVTVCKAITPPAVLFQILTSYVLPHRLTSRSSVLIPGVGMEDMLFLLGLIISWYLVGWVIDHLARLRTSGNRPVKVVFGLLSILFGVFLFCVGIVPLTDSRGYAHATASVIAGICWLAWSLGLVLFPAFCLRLGRVAEPLR